MKGDLVIHVDDSRTAREMVREALEDAGYRVLSAEDGQDLEHRVMQEEDVRNTVRLFVLDMEMPDLMGAQVGAIMSELYHELERVPFIIYSGKDREWVERMSKEVAEYSEAFHRNYKGFISKSRGGEKKLVELVQKTLEEA
ncbi:MAG: response regulator [bacterium]